MCVCFLSVLLNVYLPVRGNKNPFYMQGKNRVLAWTQKNSTNIIVCFSMCLVLIVALLLGFRMKVKELFLLYIFSPMHLSSPYALIGSYN